MKRRLSDEEKVYIIENYKSKSLGRLGQILGVCRQTIYYFYRRWLTDKKIGNRKPTGRPEMLSLREKKKIETLLSKKPRSTLREVIQTLKLDCHPGTVSKAIHKLGFKKYKMRRKPKLMDYHKAKRLAFARKYLNWRHWDKVLWTDESSVEVYKTYSTKVWRKPGEALKEGCYISRDLEFSKKYVKIWSCFSARGTGRVHFCEDWNGHYYTEQILKQHLLSEGRRLIGDEFYLMADGDTVHWCKKAEKWLKENNIKIIENWPSKSADLNPIGKIDFNLRKFVVFDEEEAG
jgi:transposase